MTPGADTTAKAGRSTGGRRPTGQVRSGLIEAGIELARAGGPDAVVLREATRKVGVAPNAAYKHFADRDELLAEVCLFAMGQLAGAMRVGVAEVPMRYGTKTGAKARLGAIGHAYLDFAVAERGLFETAFAIPDHLRYANDDAGGEGTRSPLGILRDSLDELTRAGVLAAERRPNIEYSVWATVHGLATLINQGPLRTMTTDALHDLGTQLFGFIVRAIST
ncbi:MAG TPA: TetR/AcrR family transcriptional regulator [Pseudonocardiaceae bacterium]|nr:TetR/AcrR family transcriptional regulator [Pseudonocardiaceae bacterium]